MALVDRDIAPPPMVGAPRVEAFFDAATSTMSYLVREPDGAHAAIIDPVRDYDPVNGHTSSYSADGMIARATQVGATVDWVLETHIHADHLSAADYLRSHLGPSIGVGARITKVQSRFGELFNLDAWFARNGSQSDRLFADEETFAIGAMTGRVLHTPGHTPACVTYVIGDAAFVGDTVLTPDFGTARCDFPGGDATALYRSIQRILALPPATRPFMCHDFAPGGRDNRGLTSVADQRRHNIHIGGGFTESDFVAMRTRRAATLALPQLIVPALQVNIRAGALPAAEGNGVSYLKVPLDTL